MGLTMHSIKSTALTMDQSPRCAELHRSTDLSHAHWAPVTLSSHRASSYQAPPTLSFMLFSLCLNATRNPKDACPPSSFWSQIYISGEAFTELSISMSSSLP